MSPSTHSTPRAEGANDESKIPNVLLLTGHAPGTQGVGQLFLHDLVLAYPRAQLSCFAVIEPGMASNTPDLEWLDIGYAHRPRETGYRRFGATFFHISTWFVWHLNTLLRLPALASRIARYARPRGIQVVWAVLSSPTLIILSRLVATRLGVPFVTTVWDPPELLSQNLGFGTARHKALLKAFGKAMHLSTRCGVASEGMKDEYTRDYGVASIVHIHGIPAAAQKPPSSALHSNIRLTIGFAGSVYTTQEWNALLDALSRSHWRLNGRDISLRLLTQTPFPHQKDLPIEYLGWRPAAEVIALLSEVDILYLPYWFGDSHRTVVRLCFPNKLSTYLAAGRPVLFHGPEDSSPARFLKRYPAGLCCHSMNPTDIVETLRHLVDDEAVRETAAEACKKALAEELNLDVFRRRFAELIGISDVDLVGH